MHHHDHTTNKCICEQRTNVWTSCLIISSQFQVSLTKHYAPREKCKVLTLTHSLWQATENYYYEENKKYFSKDIAVHCKIKNLFYFFVEFSLVLTVIIFNLFLFYQKMWISIWILLSGTKAISVFIIGHMDFHLPCLDFKINFNSCRNFNTFNIMVVNITLYNDGLI